MQPPGPEPRSPQAGDTVAGKYQLVRPIGLGAMGLVFEAIHLRMEQRVAIKFMQARLVGQTDAVARFAREGRAASRLTSPHATRILDVDTTPEGLPYIVSELLEGRDLRHELDEREKLPIEEAVNHVIEACAVMAEAHSFGIVHRDLKPSNLFLARTSSGRTVKVLDFGISKMEEELELTTTGIQLGSPRYMSPEQVQAKRVDRRADIWALGVILFRAISGGYPFEGTTSISLALAILTQPPRDLVALVPEAPPGLVAAIGKALAPDLSTRYATVGDLAEALAPFASPESAALARSLTREVPQTESSRPSLEMPTPGTDTLTHGKMDVDALIEVSFEPPEQATRGTWARPSTSPRVATAARTPLIVRALGLTAVAILLCLGSFSLARYGAAAHTQADVSTRRPATEATPPPAPAPVSPAETASSTDGADAAAPSAVPAARATTKSPSGGAAHVPRVAPNAAAPPAKNPTYL